MAEGLQRGASTFGSGVSNAGGIRGRLEQRHFALHGGRKRWTRPASRQSYGLASLNLDPAASIASFSSEEGEVTT
jgi:hypothetical protein